MKKAAIIGFGLCALGAVEPLWATVFDAPGGRGDHDPAIANINLRGLYVLDFGYCD